MTFLRNIVARLRLRWFPPCDDDEVTARARIAEWQRAKDRQRS